MKDLENPIAIALMATAKMSKKDRPKVKAQCMRMLANLKLDPPRTKLIGGFVDCNLTLTPKEMKKYEQEISEFSRNERNAIMEIVTSWHQEGIAQGKESLVLRQLHRRLGAVSPEITAQLARLTPEQLDNLGEALLDFSSIAELERWLAQ